MALEGDLRTFLREDANILSAFGERVFIDFVPDDSTYPFALIRTVTSDPRYNQDGEGHELVMFQVDVYDDDKAGSVTNAGYIKSRLSGHKGVMGSSVAGRVFVRDVRGEYASEIRKFRRILEVEIGTE